jgi:hypothetical protein
MKMFCLAIALALIANVVAAQAENGSPSSSAVEKRMLTNSDVVNMVKAGLPENTIVLAIQQGKNQFDTNPDTLIALKKEGVAAAILDAMLRAANRDTTPTEKVADSVTTGSISGSLSAILNNGDMKPGRLARVFLIYVNSADGWKGKTKNPPGFKTAGSQFQGEMGDLLIKHADTVMHGPGIPEAQECKWKLATYNAGLRAGSDWASANDPTQLMQTNADEEGTFTFERVPPGVWFIVAVGRAGINDSVWEETQIIEAGNRVSTKVVSPKAACPAF